MQTAESIARNNPAINQHSSATLAQLSALLNEYMDEPQIDEVRRAYFFGADAHAGQLRMTGEDYIHHPVAVACILAEMRLDYRSIIAALLHDVIEDTEYAKEQVAARFGKDVAELVDGVSKIDKLHFRTKAEAQAESFRKLLMATSQDLRVVLVKLADRMHNMRTLGIMPPAKRRRIARETLEVYSPIAYRLGINHIRLQLEDLGLMAMYPRRYQVISNAAKLARGAQGEQLDQVIWKLNNGMREHSLVAEVIGREKPVFSIYRKMRNKSLSLAEVLDIQALRIVVRSQDECYRALGVVHAIYKPMPGRFKDYIALPKSNGYQSLHTVVIGPSGTPLEIQIRTLEMHQRSDAGIAAHWRYKLNPDDGESVTTRAHEWLRKVLDLQKSGDSLEFLESVKVDLFPDEVFVFTPDGDIRRLPQGATAVDFAYAVHTGLGDKCVAAKIDRELMPLRTILQNGQQVEIITADHAHPNPAWLDFVVTAKARAAVRQYRKQLRHDEAVKVGRQLLERALQGHATSFDSLEEPAVQRVCKELQFSSLYDLQAAIGLGEELPQLVAQRLLNQPADGADADAKPEPLVITGAEGFAVTLAKCCRPIPGDSVMGFLSSGRGLVIHAESCQAVQTYKKQPDKWVEVSWEKRLKREFSAALYVQVFNQRGVLATLASIISEMGSNIEDVDNLEHDDSSSTLLFVFSVPNRQKLAEVMRKLKSMPEVIRVSRSPIQVGDGDKPSQLLAKP